MYKPVIDSHIHLDKYSEKDQEKIITQLSDYNVIALIVVAMNLKSAYDVLTLASINDQIKPALGFHPEQVILEDEEIDELIKLIYNNEEIICAIGEVGLPYYSLKDNELSSNISHLELLTRFTQLAQELNKPLALHAIYDDAPIVCNLLEKYSIKKAHFHWFKGDERTIERMIDNGYYISVTPDVLYEQETIDLVKQYPLHLMMVETDGPWPFAGPFENKLTHPKMLHDVIKKISQIKQEPYKNVADIVYHTTKSFYKL